MIEPSKLKIEPSIGQMSETSLQETDELIKEVGARLAGSPSCQKTATIIHEKMENICDDSRIEHFEMHPDSFLGFTKIITITFSMSLLFSIFFKKLMILGTIGLLIGLAMAVSQFILYLNIFDRFYPKKDGYNVSGVINPNGKVLQQIVIAGHHDSAHQFSFLKKYQKLYGIRIILGSLTYFLALVLNLANLFQIVKINKLMEVIDSNPILRISFVILQILGLVIMIPFYNFSEKIGNPGAGDNLIASMIAVNTARIISDFKKIVMPILEHTRIIILSTDGEEAGLRGAAAFVKSHMKSLHSIPTYVFNIDSIYSVNDIHFLTSDINGTVKLSKEMATQCNEFAQNMGYNSKVIPIPLGAGGTDAGEFGRAGIEATTIIAMPTDLIRDDLVYHTIMIQ
ncbi:MAG: M28 family peptidase [Promethearchaeota archaeon]